jgi:hypothetical protein
MSPSKFTTKHGIIGEKLFGNTDDADAKFFLSNG